jgi:hypothetical protein
LFEWAITDLSTQVEQHHFDGTNLLNRLDQFFDGTVFDCIEKMSGRRAASRLNTLDQGLKSVGIAATTESGMVAMGRKFRTYRPANTRARANDQTNFSHDVSSLRGALSLS